MLTTICDSLKNWFVKKKTYGQLKIENGTLVVPPDFLQENQYFRIVGSVFNDGVYKYPHGDFSDEEFHGAVWLLHIPQDFVALLDDINAWEAANKQALADATAQVLAGPYSSETFAGYTYQKKTSIGDVAMTWRDPRLGFSARLNQWRKI
jgi:hypothetical protein